MKRIFIVESDTEYSSLFLYEARVLPDGKIEKVGGHIFNSMDLPKFYGAVNAAMVTKDTLTKAAPIELKEQVQA